MGALRVSFCVMMNSVLYTVKWIVPCTSGWLSCAYSELFYDFVMKFQ